MSSCPKRVKPSALLVHAIPQSADYSKLNGSKNMANKQKLIQENPRIKKYFDNRRKGMNKKDSAISAGYPDGSNVSKIEASKTFEALASTYKEALLKETTLESLAREQMKVVLQDGDLGAKNTAIKQVMERIEPDKVQEEKEEQVIVVLAQSEPKRLHDGEYTQIPSPTEE